MTQGTQAPVAPAPPTFARPVKPVDTPALLTRWNLVVVVTVVVFGLLSAFVQFLSWQSDGRAADETEQLVRVQTIKSELLRADALATNGYLSAGLESADRKQEYDDAIGDVLKRIADAAEAQPADREALAALNQHVEDYTSNVAQAAVYNRQGVPLGIAYQTTASTDLRNVAIPVADALIKANGQRSKDAMGGQHPAYLLLIGVAALAVLFLVNRQMAQHFRRRFNGGLAVAAVIVLVATLVSTLAASAHARSNAHTRDGAYADAVSASTARTAANDAKAYESLRLINRGSGSKYEDRWVTASHVVEAAVPDRARGEWDRYVRSHQQIVKLDDTNQWKTAVTVATSAARSGSTMPLDALNTTLQKLAGDAGATATHDLRSGRSLALLLSLLTAILGLVAAVAASRGIDERQKEYL